MSATYDPPDATADIVGGSNSLVLFLKGAVGGPSILVATHRPWK